jgi:O-succinylbenzoate synthase
MKFSFSYHFYDRVFFDAFKTAHGTWTNRKGFLIDVLCDNKRVFGEVAPIPEFGTETLQEAEIFLESVTLEDFKSLQELEVPQALPCCSFALSSVISQILESPNSCKKQSYSVAGLLPSSPKMLSVFKEKSKKGFSVFKWKIGVNDFEEESALFEELLESSVFGQKFRLDANASMSEQELLRWLQFSQAFKARIDFFEQPLPVGSESIMADLSERFNIPIALDESLNGQKGSIWLSPNQWRGPLVVKPCLLGSVDTQFENYQKISDQLVFSSAFETSVGLNQCLVLKSKLKPNDFALGFDTREVFEDRYGERLSEPEINTSVIRESVQRFIENGF